MNGRHFLIDRCTVQRTTVVIDAWNVETTGDWSDHLTNLPCRWWVGIGRGEVASVGRDELMRQSSILLQADVDVVERDRISSVTDRNGNVRTDKNWEIKQIIPRRSEGLNLVLLELV